jgi:protein tyrosine phosphatase (PTP) superfamily phosphohydrolase (DUF442 family)
LHNVLLVTDGLYSGSSPEGDAGFRSLVGLGVRTVVTVDGARPDVTRAREFGLRYVHLPIGYDGVPREQALRLARAVRDLPGPVYLHCHHGKHRGPAAAAAVRRCLDPDCGAAEAVAFLREAGTDPRYRGLFADVEALAPPTPAELDAVRPDFPELAEVPPLAALMVRIDEHNDQIKKYRDDGWRSADAAHQALLLLEAYREAARVVDPGLSNGQFAHWLGAATTAAERLEGSLRQTPTNREAVEMAFRAGSAACAGCHADCRDTRKR